MQLFAATLSFALFITVHSLVGPVADCKSPLKFTASSTISTTKTTITTTETTSTTTRLSSTATDNSSSNTEDDNMVISKEEIIKEAATATIQAAVSDRPTLATAVFTDSYRNLDDDNRADFLQKCSDLCSERNLPLQKIKNARDLASVRNSPIKPGRVYRMGRVSDATDEDIAILFPSTNNKSSNVSAIRTLIDTRSPTELKDDPTLMRDQVFANFTSMVYKEQGRAKEGCVNELPAGVSPIKLRTPKKTSNNIDDDDEENNEGKGRRFWKSRRLSAALDEIKNRNKSRNKDLAEIPDDYSVPSQQEYSPDYDFASLTDIQDAIEDDDDEDEPCGLDCSESEVLQKGLDRQERHFVSLMNEWKYVKGTVSKVRKRDLTKAVLKSPGALLSKRVRTSVKDTFVDKINDGGLPMLNELLLRFGAPGIRYVLSIVADKNRHPVAFYCTAGKDRTGILAAIILAICGVELEDIVEDYALSANVYAEMNDHQAMVGALSQRNLDPATFLTAPPQVMRDTMQIINEKYGSIEEYCNWIGFGPEQQEKLRRACCDE